MPNEKLYNIQDNCILIITPDKNTPSAIITTHIPGKYLKNNRQNISQIIIVEDWSGNVLSKTAVINDKIYVFSKNSDRVKTDGVKINSTQCVYIEWSLCDDVNGMLINCQFIGTSTFGCDEALQEPGDSGGCNVVDLTKGVEIASDQQSLITTEINSSTRQNEKVWRCVKAATWGLYATTTGTISKLNPDYGTWQFDTLYHSGIGMQGSVYGGTISFNQGTAIFNPAPGPGVQSIAEMLTVNVTYTSSVSCVPVIGDLPPFAPISLIYRPTCGFNASPN